MKKHRSATCLRDVIGFDDRLMMFIGIPVASVIVFIMLFGHQINQENWVRFFSCAPLSIAYTAAFWFLIRRSYYFIWRMHPEFREIRTRIMWLVPVFLGGYFLIHLILDNFFLTFFPGMGQKPDRILDFTVSLLLSALVLAIYEAAAFYQQLIVAIHDKAELERHYVSSQLEGLRNQVNPHFLFNSLNTLIYLIPEDQTKAVNFVQKLSKVYRYVLESRDAKVIPLEEELEYLNAYVFLLKERFGQNLQVKIGDFKSEKQIQIVPLTLQMLFENAIKHNVISTEKPLNIEVFGENGHLVVRNNLQRKNQVMDSTGVGLQNIKDRYRMLTDKPVEIIASQQYFTVILPKLG